MSDDKALNDALVSAQQLRGEIREQSEREAQLIIREARSEAERYLENSRTESRKLEAHIVELERARRSHLAQLRVMVERQLKLISWPPRTRQCRCRRPRLPASARPRSRSPARRLPTTSIPAQLRSMPRSATFDQRGAEMTTVAALVALARLERAAHRLEAVEAAAGVVRARFGGTPAVAIVPHRSRRGLASARSIARHQWTTQTYPAFHPRCESHAGWLLCGSPGGKTVDERCTCREQDQQHGLRQRRVDFTHRVDRVQINDAVVTGLNIGGSAKGFIYTDSKQYDLAGTFIPMFGINNAFGRLFGPLAAAQRVACSGSRSP